MAIHAVYIKYWLVTFKKEKKKTPTWHLEEVAVVGVEYVE